MTVCIAAICDGGRSVVAASDRMLTSMYPPIEFEHTHAKIFRLSDYCIAMTAGDALRPIEIIPRIRVSIQEKKDSPDVGAIVNILKSWYQHLRLASAEELYLKPRTVSAELFYSEGAKIFSPNMYGFLDQEFTSFDYGLDVLIAGVDGDVDGGRAHIHSVSNPGISGCYDTVGFHAVGVGQMHAIQSFVAHRYDTATPLARCLHIVYAAKKASETAPGVGSDTDLRFITNGKIQVLNEDGTKNLDEIYEKVTKPRQEEISQAEKLLEEMAQSAESADDASEDKEKSDDGK